MSNKLYVTNIPFSFTDNQLGELFATIGKVDSAKIITNRNSGRSKGYGFVEMSSENEALNAISLVDGKEVEGRELKIAIATGNSTVRDSQNNPDNKNKLYVGNLPFHTKDQDLAKIFEIAGTVNLAKINTDQSTGKSKGFGFVEMSNEHELQMAIEKLDGYEIEGRQIKVNKANPKKPRYNN